MSRKFVIGVDMGSTAFKAGVFDDEGHKVATYTKEHTLLNPVPMAVEQKADVYWDTFKECIRRVLEKSGVERNAVVSLSLSVQGETIVFLDEGMKPLHNFVVWMDRRPMEEADIINSWFSAQEILEKTGQGPICSLYPASKVLWFKRRDPQSFARIKKILLLDDYIFYRLSGGFYCQGSNWCTSYMFDINTRRYWPEMLQRLGVTEAQLPTIVDSATPIGNILPNVAEELGLPTNLQLIMGGLDQSCGAVGVGNVQPGIFSESTGAALVIASMTPKIFLDPKGELPCFYPVIPGMYMLHTGAKGGIMLRWLRDTLCTDELAEQASTGRDAYDIMDEEAARIPAGSEGLVFLPFFGGAGAPATDQYAHSLLYGLDFNHTRAHIIRAFMEATVLNIHGMIAYYEKATGKPVTEIRSLGGASKSALWQQIKADLLGVPVVVTRNRQDAACFGAAILAGVGAGIWDSIAETSSRLVEVETVYQPNLENREVYDDLIRRYELLIRCTGSHTKELYVESKQEGENAS